MDDIIIPTCAYCKNIDKSGNHHICKLTYTIIPQTHICKHFTPDKEEY